MARKKQNLNSPPAKVSTLPSPKSALALLLDKQHEQAQAVSAQTAVVNEAGRELRQKIAGAEEKLNALQVEQQKIQDQIKRQKSDAFAKALTDDFIDALASEHEGSGCSDEFPRRESSCTRCALKVAKQSEWINFEWSFHIDLGND